MVSRHDLYFMLHVPPSVAPTIVRLQRQLHLAGGPSKPMAAERLHTTLVTLGSYPNSIPSGVLRTVREAGALLDEVPFQVCFDTLRSRSPQSDVGTVELAGRGDGVQPLYRLRRHLVGVLLKAGWPGESIRSRYIPHITLDYRHAPVGTRRVDPVAWDVTEVLLVDSHYGCGHHDVLSRWPLQERQAPLFA